MTLKQWIELINKHYPIELDYAEWIPKDFFYDDWECSNCGNTITIETSENIILPKYCEKCKKKMKRGE